MCEEDDRKIYMIPIWYLYNSDDWTQLPISIIWYEFKDALFFKIARIAYSPWKRSESETCGVHLISCRKEYRIFI